MGARHPQGHGLCLRHLLGFARQSGDLSHHIFRHAFEPLASGRQTGGLGAAVHQIGADPLFQRTYSSAEGRLRAAPVLGGTRKMAGLSQGQKVFQPNEIHVRFVQCMAPAKTSIGFSDSFAATSPPSSIPPRVMT
jgi:hypothetical protein